MNPDDTFIDAGANINLLRYDPEEIDEMLHRAKDNNISSIILIGGSISTTKSAKEVAENSRRRNHGVKVYFTAGLHPLESFQWNDTTEGILLELCSHPLCVAVGETGLNYHNNNIPSDVQKWVFKKQLNIATTMHLPVYIHDREAAEDILTLIEEHNITSHSSLKYLIHCYEGAETIETVKKQIKLGFYFSFSGLVTIRQRNAQVLRSLSVIPPDRIMTETDTPYLKPSGLPSEEISKSHSEPSHITTISDFISQRITCCKFSFAAVASSFFNLPESDNRFTVGSPSESPQARSRPSGLFTNSVINCAQTYSKQPISKHRFLIPFTLVKLCKQLRGVGLDTQIHPNNDIKQVLASANKDRRIVILRHTKAIKKVIATSTEVYSQVEVLELRSDVPKEQVQQIISERGINLKEADLQGRCKVCNSDMWIKEKPSAVRGEVEDSVASTYRRFWRCAGCRKVYWEGWVYSQAKEHFRSIGGLQKEHNSKNHVKTLNNQTCKKQRTKRSSMKHDHNLQFDCISIIPLHSRYGVLLIEGQSGEGSWTLPSATFRVRVSADDTQQKALDLAQESLGLSLQSYELIPFKTSHTSKRRFFTLYLADHHSSIPGELNARPPAESGIAGRPPFWLRSNRNFIFAVSLKSAWTSIKLGGVSASGDMVGSLVLRDLHARDQICQTDNTSLGHSMLHSAHFKSQVMHRTKTVCRGVNPDSYGRIELSLLQKGIIDPGKFRILWDTRPPPTWVESIITKLDTKSRLDKDLEKDYIAVLLSWYPSIAVLQEDAYRKSVSVQKLVSEAIAKTTLSDHKPYLFGSVASGIVSNNGDYDIDICLINSSEAVRSSLSDDEYNEEHEVLLDALHYLYDSNIISKPKAILAARVPVVRGSILSTPVDVAVAPLGCVNTLLFRKYFSKKPSLRLVAIIVKIWGTWAGIKSKDVGHLTAYSLIVLLIYFAIQTDVVEWIPLSKMSDISQTYESFTPIRECDVAECPKILFSFLGFYSDFDWSQNVVCIRQFELVKRFDASDDPLPVVINDPYEDLNLARKMKGKQLSQIVRKFKLSFATMRNGMLFKLIL